jgi:hypothetical protein
MKPKLRKILTTRRATSVPRKAIRAAVKAVAAERTPEMERLIRGVATPEEAARALGKYPMPAAGYERSVFVNCPLDEEYRYLFEAGVEGVEA